MARPIKETPILYGQDAVRFMERAQKVENMSREERSKNRRLLENRISKAKHRIEVYW